MLSQTADSQHPARMKQTIAMHLKFGIEEGDRQKERDQSLVKLLPDHTLHYGSLGV